MADRGRKAYPVSSHVCDEKWQKHCMDLHKQRLSDMKHRVDTSKPDTYDIKLSAGKRLMLEKERQFEVDRENAILLQKMVRIKEQDTRAVFRPWTARSTFQWKAGHYYDPTTGTKTLDHINLTSSSSPRSIHYYTLARPGTAPPDVASRLRDMQVQADNTKLLRAITTMRSAYNVEELERKHHEESVLVNRISNYRGPDSARYQPPGRSVSASRRSPYLSSIGGNLSPRAVPRPLGGSAGSSRSMAQYYEDAQKRDLPPARGGSRPTTAVMAAREEGLGETTPPPGGKASPLGSAYGSRSGSVKGGDFSFDKKEAAAPAKAQDPAASADDYADEEYEKDEDAGAEEAAEARASSSGAKEDAEEGYGDEGFEQDDAAGRSGQQEEDDEEQAAASTSNAYEDDAAGADEGQQEEEEEEPAAEASGTGHGDEEEAAAALGGGDEEEEEQEQEESPRASAEDEGEAAAAGEGESEAEAKGQDDEYGNDGFEAEQEAVAAEVQQAEAAEMEQEMAAEMEQDAAAGEGEAEAEAEAEPEAAEAEAAGGDSEDLGTLAQQVAAVGDDDAEAEGQQSLKVGGFADDWD